MAILWHQASGRRVTLSARSLVGRAAHCTVQLAGKRASAEHAVMFFDGMRWSLRDLGSTNGTQLADSSLERGERCFLEAGAVMTFADETERWTLTDDGPPVASAHRCEGDEVLRAERGLLALPSTEQPILTLVQDEHARWLVELDDALRPAVDQEEIVAAGSWRLHIPPTAADDKVVTTVGMDEPDAKLLGTTLLRFDVSRDEEYVELSLVHAGEITQLGARAHLEPLLLLARERLTDTAAGVTESEQGWLYVDDLLRQMDLDLHHFNVQVYRARKQLATAGVLNVGALVERRSTTRQVRLGTSTVQVRQL